MSLPPLLLERLKRRKIIQETSSPSQTLERQNDDTSRKSAEFSGSIGDKHKLGGTIEIEEALGQDQEEIIAENYSDEEEENGDEEEEEVREEEEDDKTEQKDNQDAFDNSSHESELEQDANNPSGTSGSHDKEDDKRKHVQTYSHIKDESVIGCPNKYNIYHECGQYCIDNYSKPEILEPTMEQRKQLALILRTYPMSNEWTVVYDPGVEAFYFWNIISNLVSWLPPGMNGFISMSADQMRKIIREMGQTQDSLE